VTASLQLLPSVVFSAGFQLSLAKRIVLLYHPAMFTCPACKKGLDRFKTTKGFFWACPSCKGHAATVPFLRQTLLREYVNQIWTYARAEKGVRRRPCPACRDLMIDVPIVYGEVSQWIDVCTRCQFIWFDAREYEESPSAVDAPSGDPDTGGAPLSPEARQALAIQKVKQLAVQARNDPSDDGIDAWWQVLPAVLGLPIEEEVTPVRREPWLTWILAGVIAVASIAAFFDLRGAIDQFGFIPAQAGRYGGLTFVTAFFLHGGILHLVGNLYFLLVFGDNVEDFLGWRRYALLLVAATLAGFALHIAGDPNANVPCVGASGGIAGVIAFYAFRFPRARLGFYWRYFFSLRRILMPAWLAFAFWLLFQFVIAGVQMRGFSPVSALAHLGGAAVGVACWVIWRKQA
jgi:membrane associated rhomboid family serine protease/Zn-finger nucleic acid-binding protein